MSLVKRLLERNNYRYGIFRRDLQETAAFLSDSGLSRSEISARVGEKIREERRAARANRAEAAAAGFPNAESAPLVEMRLTGVEELDALFLSLPDAMQKKALRPACRQVAAMVLADARARVRVKSGFLQSQLIVKPKRRSRRYPQTVGTTVGFKDDLFKGDTYYAGFLEFGTETRRQKSRKYKSVGKIDAAKFEFLKVSLFANQERKEQVFLEHLQRWLVRYNKKLGRLKKQMAIEDAAGE